MRECAVAANVATTVDLAPMIIVTGTRRSGTSLWMQILQQGGFRILGEKFPAHWKQHVEKANARGFFESTLVQGINYHTNPDPRSGAWIPPDKSADIAVKIFADGLVKTDYSYISRVVCSIRGWQECEASQSRMDEIIGRSMGSSDEKSDDAKAVQLPPGYSWWKAYFSLVRDMQTRRYPAAVFSYAGLLEKPEQTIAAAFEWLGGGNIAAAAGAVDSSMRTQSDIVIPDVGHDYGAVFDELHDVLSNHQQISPAFFQKLEETDRKISAHIDALQVNKE